MVLCVPCRLCLQSYHLVAIGMPDSAQQGSSATTNNSISDADGQQQDDAAGNSTTVQQENIEIHAQGTHVQENAAQGAALAAPMQGESNCQGSCALPTVSAAVPRTAGTDAGTQISTNVVTLKAAACSAGGSSSTLMRSVLPQLPLPHLLHLELDGCR